MTRHPATRLAAVLTMTAATLGLAYGLARGAPAPDPKTEPIVSGRWCTQPTVTQGPGVTVSTVQCYPTRGDMLADQLLTERHQTAARVRAAYRRGIQRGRRVAVTTPDAHVAARLAALAYGQSAQHLLACARSEGYREAERHQAHNTRPNTAGSGARGALQFMPGTFAATPQGRAGLPITRVDVQLHAAAWMWSRGMRGHWTGRGC